MTHAKVVICPYCGEMQPTRDSCRACAGLFEALSRQASHNAMGPWFVHDRRRPFQPGCSYETLAKLIERGKVTKNSIVRGPTTKQFWTVARHVPGVAHLLGYCHACDARVDPADHGCSRCGVPFGAYLDRNYLGLPDVRPLPGDAPGDDHPAGESWSPPPMTPRGISSFAADEELLAAGDPHNGSSSVATMAAARPTAVTRSGEAARSRAPDELFSSPVVRSMQRRLQRQQRTIRLLTVVVLVVALAGALFNVLAVSTAGRGDARTSSGDTAANGPAEIDRPAVPVDETPARPEPRPEDETTARPEPRSEDETTAAPPPPAEPAPPVPSAAAEPTFPDYDRAMTLVDAARRTDRGDDDRLADYRAALDLLRSVAAAPPGDPRPPDLDDRIERVELAIERLRLKAFFEPPG